MARLRHLRSRVLALEKVPEDVLQAYGGIALAYAVLPDYSAKISYLESYALSTDRDSAHRPTGPIRPP